MDRSLKASIESLIKSKRGFEFEAFVNKMHLVRYGSENYYCTRERRDEGADGIILTSNTVIASYGPDTYDETKYKKKANEDFDMYIEKWVNAHSNWCMYYNNSLAPAQIKHCELLKKNAKKKGHEVSVKVCGIEQIIHYIETEFTNKQIRLLAENLGVNKDLMVFDYIKTILDDLIRGVGVESENIEYKNRIDIEEKITLNYSQEDKDAALDEYATLVIDGTLTKIRDAFSTYESEEINSIKMKIKRNFNQFSGDFKTKVNNVAQNYQSIYANIQDDDFEYYTRALLVYCFEQCMIGVKPNKTEDLPVC